jgi:hypothetical protein
MTLKMHHVAPKCIHFFNTFPGVIPSVSRLQGERKKGGEGNGKSEEAVGRGEGSGGKEEGRDGVARVEGREGGEGNGRDGKEMRASSLFKTTRCPWTCDNFPCRAQIQKTVCC